jgi:hypothetical protein
LQTTASYRGKIVEVKKRGKKVLKVYQHPLPLAKITVTTSILPYLEDLPVGLR